MLIETFYWAMNSLTGSQDRAGDRYMLNERFYWTMVSQTGSQDRAGDMQFFVRTQWFTVQNSSNC